MNEKVFRDPVHNYIHVNNQIIYDLINTKEFQRLRRIKQLGTSSYTFHGGEHSRFSHCLGVYEIARRITEIFEEKYPEETLYGVIEKTGGEMPMATFPGWVKYKDGDPLKGTSYEVSYEIPEGFFDNFA